MAQSEASSVVRSAAPGSVAIALVVLVLLPGLAGASGRSLGVSTTIATGKHPSGALIAAGSLWVTNDVDNTVSRIDPDTNAVAQTIALRGAGFPDPAFETFDGKAVWVVAPTTGTVSRLDARTGALTATTAVPGLALGI